MPMPSARPLRVAVIGSGPAGMYAIGYLLEESGLEVEIDLFERLPTPWGLIRAGVAPDHPEKKLVIDRLFSHYFNWPQVRFMGNVEIGKHVHHAELMAWYDAVVYAVGAAGDTKMGIPGEGLPGSWAAREFVSWYNGHPDFSHLRFDLSCERAVIIGNGNVAMDVARILTMPLEQLAQTDIADHALAALGNSNVREVVILGRRDHTQGAFNNPELEELEHIRGVEVVVESDGFPGTDEPSGDSLSWEARRKVSTLRRLASRPMAQPDKRIVFSFLSSPVALLGNEKVEQVVVAKNRQDRGKDGRLTLAASGEKTVLEAGLVLRAIGYRSCPFPGLPFDDDRNVIENIDGRVSDGGVASRGAYVTGWAKRGPRGVIGTNKQCARDTVKRLCADATAGLLSPATLTGKEVFEKIIARQPELVSKNGWRTIDHVERDAGRRQSRPRVKLTDIEAMIRLASQG